MLSDLIFRALPKHHFTMKIISLAPLTHMFENLLSD
jgi:hypothetical protein